jgi:hypothetical protein
MGKPMLGYASITHTEHISVGGAPGELKHLSTRRKRKDSASSGERTRRSPRQVESCSRSGLESRTKQGESPVGETVTRLSE